MGMRLPTSAFLLVLALRATSDLSAQQRTPRSEPASDSELAGISARGRRLAQYDWVAWHASDAVMALRPDTARMGLFIPRRTAEGWRVAFGRLTAARDTFLVGYEATIAPGDTGFRAAAVSPARADTDYFRNAARAIKLSAAAFGPVGRPYNVAAFPSDDGGWWVYLYPAATQAGVWPLGGDERFLVSADGRTIRARRRMHKAVIEYSAPTEGEAEMFTHAAILDDVPEDTDVFVVMTRTPRVPEYVVTEAFLYRLDVDGSIHFMGATKDVLRTK